MVKQNKEMRRQLIINFYFSLRVAKDDGLGDGESIVEIAERVEFPLLPFNGHEKLLDSFQSQFITMEQ